MKSKILVRGVGVIGFPLLSILLELKKIYTNLEIYFEPFEISKQNIFQLNELISKNGILVITEKNNSWKNQFKNYVDIKIYSEIDLVYDCSPSGVASSRKSEYNKINFPKTICFIAQGSEHDFGKQIIYPENISILENSEDKFLHIGTCNSHSLVCIIRNLERFSEIENIDFVVVRRDADMAKNDPHVTGPLFQIPNHSSGTHHVKYIEEIYSSIGKTISMSSSSLTVNSPYMHVIRFNARLKNSILKEKLENEIKKDFFSSISFQNSTNMIFSSGRERGFTGRIFSHGVWILPCLEVDEKTVRGFVATPGDSNVIFSSIILGFLKLNLCNEKEILENLKKYLIKEI